eukprot:TRINITY_DN24352_c0_g10_i1.p1 TRINITY_DN24352_c0_g10~~TRINITY_DN24352_c0_g10_i1.p1  ORF type:complete len:167 (-),score=23.56 TRINITY_DN24352_c0_g10_i1:117-617(-)
MQRQYIRSLGKNPLHTIWQDTVDTERRLLRRKLESDDAGEDLYDGDHVPALHGIKRSFTSPTIKRSVDEILGRSDGPLRTAGGSALQLATDTRKLRSGASSLSRRASSRCSRASSSTSISRSQEVHEAVQREVEALVEPLKAKLLSEQAEVRRLQSLLDSAGIVDR